MGSTRGSSIRARKGHNTGKLRNKDKVVKGIEKGREAENPEVCKGKEEAWFKKREEIINKREETDDRKRAPTTLKGGNKISKGRKPVSPGSAVRRLKRKANFGRLGRRKHDHEKKRLFHKPRSIKNRVNTGKKRGKNGIHWEKREAKVVRNGGGDNYPEKKGAK